MSECESKRHRFFCPTKWDFFRAIGGLMPHGRAHQSDDWAYGATSNEELPTPMQRWWAAFAEVLEVFSRHVCRAMDEFWCVTASDTLALWYRDYGFPDECTEYDNLCAKVAARGGSDAKYIERVAFDNGWLIEVKDGRVPHVMDVDIFLQSPALAVEPGQESEYPQLTCLLGKITPAHIQPHLFSRLDVRVKSVIGVLPRMRIRQKLKIEPTDHINTPLANAYVGVLPVAHMKMKIYPISTQSGTAEKEMTDDNWIIALTDDDNTTYLIAD